MDSKRVKSGFLVAPAVAILILIKNVYIIGLFTGVITLYAMDEYIHAISRVCKPVKWLAYLSCILVIIMSIIPSTMISGVVLFTIPVIITMLFLLVIISDMKITFKDIAFTGFGICYVTFFMSFIPLINNLEHGKILLGYVLFFAWGNDIFAYCIGKRWGKHKFSKVSPKKSIEGSVAGILGAVIISLIYTIIINNVNGLNYSYIYIIIISVVLSIIGQIGDFSASTIKRYVDIKDFSNLLPGHGGMLDRIDSVLFIAPFAYALFLLII